MHRRTPADPPNSARQERRRFLKQLASGAAAGTMPLSAWAQEKPASPAASGVPAGQPLVAETLARYAASLKYEDLPAEVSARRRARSPTGSLPAPARRVARPSCAAA
jgi:hypothetical protein